MKKKRSLIFLLTILAMAFVFAGTGCRAEETANDLIVPDEEKLKIYTSFFVLADFAKAIAGERAEVVNLVPAGITAHEWEPGPRVMMDLAKADIFVYNGFHLEPWVDKVLAALEAEELLVVKAGEGIEPIRGYRKLHDHDHAHDDHEPGDDHGDDPPDPHVWMDPLLALHQAGQIKLALIQVDPEHEDRYRQNFERFAQEINRLDEAYRNALAAVPRREFVVTHLSFGYLAARYGLKQVGIAGLTPHVEPSPAELRKIVKFIKEKQIAYIFTEPLINPRIAEVLADEAGVQLLSLNAMEGITQEQMDAGLDYFSIMYENLDQLIIALR